MIKYSLYLKLYKMAEKCNTFDDFQIYVSKSQKEHDIPKEILGLGSRSYPRF